MTISKNPRLFSMVDFFTTILSRPLVFSLIFAISTTIIVSILALTLKATGYNIWYQETDGSSLSGDAPIVPGGELFLPEYPDSLNLKTRTTVYLSAGIAMFVALITAVLVYKAFRKGPLNVSFSLGISYRSNLTEIM
jgi:hypothetical protein